MNKPDIYDSAESAALAAAEEFKRTAEKVLNKRDRFFAALSGGSTPQMLFEKLTGPEFKEKINWSKIHFFWADERMVPPDSPESNYGMAKKILLDNILVPDKNVHRIKGENDPDEELLRYAGKIDSNLKKNKDDFPCFDLILLGMGEDGHTASLFPGKELLLKDKKNICGLAESPQGQKRITLTKKTINAADKVIFLVSGASKGEILSNIMYDSLGKVKYPAASIFPESGSLKWIIDKEAGKLLR